MSSISFKSIDSGDSFLCTSNEIFSIICHKLCRSIFAKISYSLPSASIFKKSIFVILYVFRAFWKDKKLTSLWLTILFLFTHSLFSSKITLCPPWLVLCIIFPTGLFSPMIAMLWDCMLLYWFVFVSSWNWECFSW